MQIMDLGEKMASSQHDLLSSTAADLSAAVNWPAVSTIYFQVLPQTCLLQ
jgi:hypothetical protein